MAFINVGPNRAFTTITKGVSIANGGDTLLIDEGIYNEEIYINSKHVNLVGNTQNPHYGKVKVERFSASATDECLYIKNVQNKVFYFEGIHFAWSKADSADSNYSIMILFENCAGTTMIFNKCIIDASFYFSELFQSEAGSKIRLLNCSINYKPVTNFYSANIACFAKHSSDVLYDIRKCVVPYELEPIAFAQLRSPEGANINTLLDATISGGWSNVSNMFDNSTDTYCSLNGTTIGQPYYLYVTYDQPKIISRWMYYDRSTSGSSNYTGKIKLQASNDLVYWVDTPASYTRNDYYRVEAFATQLKIPYKYYRLEILAVLSSIQLCKLIFLEKGEDRFQFDYVKLPGKIGYGPAYGDYITSLPTQYSFSGVVFDNIFGEHFVDTVTWNSSDKSSNISLSNDNCTATVLTSNKYIDCGVRATSPRKIGKWYWEFKSSSVYGFCRVGLGTYQASTDYALGYDACSWGYEYKTGYIYHKNSIIVEGPPSVSGDVIGVAYNAYDGKIWFSRNGYWFFDGDPVSNNRPTVEIQADLYPMASLQSSATVNASVDLLISTTNLNYNVPEGYSFYGTNFIWRIKAINAITNVLEGWTYSSPVDSSYELFTMYSGSHFLICEDTSEDRIYNDLLLGRLVPEEFIV